MHKFHPSFLREYDARGIVGESLTLKDAYYLGRAFGTQVRRQGGNKISVGWDGRHSSPQLCEALIKGLLECGIHILKVGLGPTPMTYFSVYQLKTDGCIMVTGSHNPPEYNGFKMMLGEKTIFGADISTLGNLAENGDFETGQGRVENIYLNDIYIERLLKDITRSNLRVGWDPANGSAGEIVMALTKQLAGDHFVINGKIDGDFPDHPADPTVEKNLTSLRALVAREKLDLGIGFDGDGDRLGVVDRNGRIIWGDQILAILAKDVLKELPGATIIADIKSSRFLFDEIRRMGGNPVMWKTGHSLIKSQMKKLAAPLAGEMSGHFYFQHNYYGFDDAIFAALKLLSIITKEHKDIAQMVDEMPKPLATKEMRFECADEVKFKIIKNIRQQLKAKDVAFIDIDGVRVETNEGWWLIRASNTQPALVARCEGTTPKNLKKLQQEIQGYLENSQLRINIQDFNQNEL